jgi:tetratricopeptide (TPR) repeat protein
MAGNQIEKLIEAGKWKQAEDAIRKRLGKEPDNHWLWARLSTAKYELHDYEGALAAAEKALEIVPDCPLAKWEYAGALEMLGKIREAGDVYFWLLRRGLEELKTPDEDAEECWEGRKWTLGIMVDCTFRVAGLLAKIGKRDRAIKTYHEFLDLVNDGSPGIYTKEDAEAKLKKLEMKAPKIPDVKKQIRALFGHKTEWAADKVKA